MSSKRPSSSSRKGLAPSAAGAATASANSETDVNVFHTEHANEESVGSLNPQWNELIVVARNTGNSPTAASTGSPTYRLAGRDKETLLWKPEVLSKWLKLQRSLRARSEKQGVQAVARGARAKQLCIPAYSEPFLHQSFQIGLIVPGTHIEIDAGGRSVPSAFRLSFSRAPEGSIDFLRIWAPYVSAWIPRRLAVQLMDGVEKVPRLSFRHAVSSMLPSRPQRPPTALVGQPELDPVLALAEFHSRLAEEHSLLSRSAKLLMADSLPAKRLATSEYSAHDVALQASLWRTKLKVSRALAMRWQSIAFMKRARAEGADSDDLNARKRLYGILSSMPLQSLRVGARPPAPPRVLTVLQGEKPRGRAQGSGSWSFRFQASRLPQYPRGFRRGSVEEDPRWSGLEARTRGSKAPAPAGSVEEDPRWSGLEARTRGCKAPAPTEAADQKRTALLDALHRLFVPFRKCASSRHRNGGA